MNEQSTTSGGNVCPYCHLTIMPGWCDHCHTVFGEPICEDMFRTVHACAIASQSLNRDDLPYGEAWKIKAAKEAARADKAEAEVRRLRAAIEEHRPLCNIDGRLYRTLDEEPPCPSETKP